MPSDASDKLLTLRRWARRHRVGLVRASVIFAAMLAVPFSLFYFTPKLLVWTAPQLDLGKDLYAANRPVAFTFLDADGHLAGRRGALVGERLGLDEMPAYLPAAFIAMEDRSFYENDGIDVRGLLRAAWMNLRAGHVVAGGSTITQQTAKIVFLSPKRTFARKYDELLDAAALQKSLTKKQILELYLNRIYLGSGAYGVDGAAHVYFGKSARNLTLAEAAMLATLTRAPSAFSPRRDLAAAQARADLVLRAMVRTGAITGAEAEDASLHPAAVSDRALADARNFFLDTAADEALRLIGSAGVARDSDLIVHTTLQPRLQEAARHALAHTLNAQGRRAHASEGAIVLMKPDGAVAALIGGRDYDASVFDRATQARRQPGSAFKPFVYLTALEKGISPWDVRDDGPVDIGGWTPTNYGGRSYGSVTLAEALAHSINTVTAGLGQEVGITNVVAAARRCGIASPLTPDASLALGTSVVTPIELTTAYAVFASGGLRVKPYLVTAVEDSTHQPLYRRVPAAPARVIAADVDRDLTAMLYGVLVEGTGRAAALPGREAAGKTGTTQDYRDAWFVGFTPDYVAGVWVGNDNYSPMRNVTGGTLPAAIWKDVMTAAEYGLPASPLDKSTRPPPEDNQATETASASDDGADTNSDDESVQEEQEKEQDQSGQHRSFWDWLFGSGHAEAAPPRQDSDAPDQAGHTRDNVSDRSAPPPPAVAAPEQDERTEAGPQQDFPAYGPPPRTDRPEEGRHAPQGPAGAVPQIGDRIVPLPPDGMSTYAPPPTGYHDEFGEPPPPPGYGEGGAPPPTNAVPRRDPPPPPPIVVYRRDEAPPPPPPPPPPPGGNDDDN